MDQATASTVFFWAMLIVSVANKHPNQPEVRRKPDEIARRRRVTSEWPSPMDECCICLDSYTPGKYVRVARCGHVFHAACFTRLVRGATLCPLCRTALV